MFLFLDLAHPAGPLLSYGVRTLLLIGALFVSGKKPCASACEGVRQLKALNRRIVL